MNDLHESPLAKKVLDRIEGEHLSPRPRWEFLAQDWIFWLLGAIAVALGALAIAAALFELANAGWSFYTATHKNFLSFFIEAVPFLWLLALALFILLGYENIRRTRRGYRYPFWLIALGAVLTSALIGSALFAAGAGESVEEALGDHPPFYRPVEVEQEAWWLSPAQGLLGGTVVSVSSTSDSFALKDFDGDLWQVDAGNLSTTSEAVVVRGGQVRIIGVSASSSGAFTACSVLPWKIHGSNQAALEPEPFAPLPHERTFTAARITPCKGASPYHE